MIEIEVYLRSSVANIPTIIILVLTVVIIVVSCIFLCRSMNLYGSHRSASPLGLSKNLCYWLRGVARFLLLEYMVLVFCSAVVFRNTSAESTINLIPFSSYYCIAENSYLKEVAVINLLNVVMFVPIGMLLKPAFCNNDNHNVNLNWKGSMVLGLLLSMAIEVLQFVFKKGLCEIDDVIHNVIGCMTGYGLYCILQNLHIKPS